MHTLAIFKDAFFTVLEFGIQELIELNNVIEAQLDHELSDFEKWINENAKKLTEDQKSDFYEFYADDHYRYSERFPSLMRSSLLVTCYSFIENNLLHLCRQLKNDRNLKVKPEDLVGKGIIQAQKYLKTVLEMDFPDQTKQWQEILDINGIRNVIVHEQGYVASGNDKVCNYIKNNNHIIELDNRNNVKLSNKYIIHFLTIIRDFFSIIKNKF